MLHSRPELYEKYMSKAGKYYKDVVSIGDPIPDRELAEQILALKIVIAYLVGREDAHIVTSELRRNLCSLEQFQHWRTVLK
jgi:hypothetical protein